MTSNENQPAPLHSDAYIGVLGDFVRLVQSETEADPDVILIQSLVTAGCLFHRHAFVEISGREHHTNLNMCVVGDSGSGRKGTANDAVRLFFREVDHDFWSRKVLGGMSTGEGLRDPIRDAIHGPDKKNPQEQVLLDPGEPDKRLLIYESEFAVPLVCMTREGNTLSQAVRQAFDGEDLRNLTKRDKTCATAPHVSIVGNITRDELMKQLQTGTDMTNGFANRFLWVYAKQRTKLLPSGGRLLSVAKSPEFRELVRRFNGVYVKTCDESGQSIGGHSRLSGELRRDDEATLLWGTDDGQGGMYRELENAGHKGRLADVTKRASVMVMRLALVYALLDPTGDEDAPPPKHELGESREQPTERELSEHKKLLEVYEAAGWFREEWQPTIQTRHLKAAYAVWKYCEDSARSIFDGNQVTDPVAGKILEAVRTNNGYGMSATKISNLFGRNEPKEKLEQAKALLVSRRLLRVQAVPSEGGRPTLLYFAMAA